MAKQKENKPRGELASRWEFFYGDRPQSYELPEGVALQTVQLNPDEEIICADCGKAVAFKDSRNSPLIRHRRKNHISYLVCDVCYFREKDEHRRILEKMMSAKG